MSPVKIIYSKLFLLVQVIVLAGVFISCENEAMRDSDKITELHQAISQKLNSSQIDSLFHEIDLCQNDSLKVDLLLDIYKKSIRSRPIRKDILDSAIALSKRINYKLGIAKSLDKKGLNLRYNLEYQASVDYHKMALGYFRQTRDTFGTIKCLNSLGVSLRRLNSEKEAIKYYLQALQLSREINNKKSIAVALNGIGNVFVNIGQYDKALPYFREGLLLEKNSGNKRGINYDLSNIGEVYMHKQQYDSALYFYYQALDIANELNHKDNSSVIYNCIGQLYQLKGNYSKSNEYFQEAIPKLIKFDGQRYLSNTFINMGINETHLHRMDEAFAHITKGLQIAKDIQSPENIILAYQALSQYYQSAKNYQAALEHYQKYIYLRDSINGDDTKRNIAALESIYENEKKDNEIKQYQFQVSLQKKQSIIQWTIILSLLRVVSFLFALYVLKRRNNKLIIDQMRNDIQEYIERIEEYKNKPDEVDEKDVFYKNVEKYGLSERELEVLLLISKGLKNDEVAEKLFLSVSTVKTHTRNIFVKLDVRNRIEASRKAQNI